VCGRYAASRNPDDLVEEFEVEVVETTEVLPPDFNVAPTKPVYAILERPEKHREELHPARHPRQLRIVQWGLVPSWAGNPKIGNRLINARAETLAEKPAFRKAFAARRCLLPADGYYEWQAVEGSKRKQPYFIRPRDGGVLAMAGLYEIWRDPQADRFLWTCTIITTDAPDDLGRIHDRMPMFVEPDAWSAWLDPTLTDPDKVSSLLIPAAPGRLEAYPVGTDVNNVDNNSPDLIAPLPEDVEPETLW
jgi:putative SOS response-associated peptidase YedK